MSDAGNPHLNDRELQALAGEIDRLAFSDQAREGLELRIHAATLPLLQQSADSQPRLRLVGMSDSSPAVRARHRRLMPMRIAAGFALFATVGLTWMATRQSSPVPTPAGPAFALTSNTTDEWAILSFVMDDTLSDEIDDLRSAASSLGTSIQGQGLSDVLEEGAM